MNKNAFFILFFLFTFSLLILFLFHQNMTLATLREAKTQDDLQKLTSLGENVKKQFEKKRVGQEEPYDLYLLAKETGAKQILLIGNDRSLLADSTREAEKNEKVPLSISLHKALAGETQYHIFDEPSDKRWGEIFLPIREGRVIHITALLPPIKNPSAESLLIFIKLFGWGGGGILGYYALRLLLKRSSTDALTGAGQQEEGGLLVHTFQGVIHQLKEKEQALIQMNENILQSVTSGVVTFNCDGRVTTVNPAAEMILGRQREVLLNCSCEGLFGEGLAIAAHLNETLAQKKEATREECEVVQQNGQKKCLGFTTSALRDRSGAIIGAIIVFVDLTEMKALQAQVDLKKRFEMMGEVSAWIAHEFRSYMGTIMGYASLLSKAFEQKSVEQGMTRAISSECVAMDRLITDLLSYGKKPFLALCPIPLTPLIEEVLDKFKFNTPDVRFETALEAAEIAADRTLIRQALSNLIQNGIQAMDKRGVLGIRLAHLRDGSVEIKISDSGRGIPANQIDKIFLPFFTTREQGSGLGLALVHKIILSHNGAISVESKLGEGTTFTITLPARRL
jgi:PAS domain S-box-containing protein